MEKLWEVYSTFGTKEEALFVGRRLIEEKLAACVNIGDSITSIYRWQGVIQQENEIVMTAKTRAEKCNDVIALIKSLHSYELPCIVAWPIENGFAPYLQWIAEETENKGN